MSVSVGCKTEEDAMCVQVYNVSGVSIGFQNNVTKKVSPAKLPSGQVTPVTLSDQVKPGSFAIINFSTKEVLVKSFPTENEGKIVVTSKGFVRPVLKRQKIFTYWIPIIGFLIVAVLAFAFIKPVQTYYLQQACESENLDAQECENELRVNAINVKKPTLLYVIGGISLFISLLLLGFWLYAEGPWGYASYGACKKRTGYTTLWKWVQPRSGLRKFLCTVFGSCECAADEMNLDCLVHSLGNDGIFSWKEEEAAKSKSSSDVCFCCSKNDNLCFNVVDNKTCSKQ